MRWGSKLLIIILLLIFLLTFVITKVIEPTLVELCKVRAQSIGTLIANEVVQKVMHDIEYLDLVILDRDESGKIMALRANVIEMNRIASLITEQIQERNNSMGGQYVKIPLRKLHRKYIFIWKRSDDKSKTNSDRNSENRI